MNDDYTQALRTERARCAAAGLDDRVADIDAELERAGTPYQQETSHAENTGADATAGADGDQNAAGDGGSAGAGDGVPAGNAADILGWVDGDAGRAAAALDVERAAKKPRKGLIGDLEAIAAGPGA